MFACHSSRRLPTHLPLLDEFVSELLASHDRKGSRAPAVSGVDGSVDDGVLDGPVGRLRVYLRHTFQLSVPLTYSLLSNRKARRCRLMALNLTCSRQKSQVLLLHSTVKDRQPCRIICSTLYPKSAWHNIYPQYAPASSFATHGTRGRPKEIALAAASTGGRFDRKCVSSKPRSSV